MFAVSAGFGCEELCKKFSEANNDDYRVVQHQIERIIFYIQYVVLEVFRQPSL